MVLLSTIQSIYITFAIIGGVVVTILLFVLIYKNFLKEKFIKWIVGTKLYRTANLNDYLLLNNYKINIDDNNIGVIDHILITNKYIVVIHDFSISGVISPSNSEDTIKVTNKNGDKLIANPLNYNRNLAKRLALYHNLDNTFIKGLVVVNDYSLLNDINKSEQFRFVRLKELKRTISEFEKGDVKPFKEDAIVSFINYLNEHQAKKGARK